MLMATCEASANIAVVKYWGKRNDEHMLPMNSSLSFTMDEKLKTRTTVMFSSQFSEDQLWLNDENIDLKDNKNRSHLKPLEIIRKQAQIDAKMCIVSRNYFPTGAGFASSASGVAALVSAAVHAAKLSISSEELSILARLGSGSASRSIFGGFVEWHKGNKEDGSDSFAEQIASAEHWPQLRNVIAITAAEKKKISSRKAMRQTVATSNLYKARLENVPTMITEVKKAVENRDFASFGTLTMRESNSLHAVMLDTWPPICYLNDTSKCIIKAIGGLNCEEIIAAYTFDAGPNAHIYTTEDNVLAVKEALNTIPGVQDIIVCKIGNGPKILDKECDSLIDTNGKPRLEGK